MSNLFNPLTAKATSGTWVVHYASAPITCSLVRAPRGWCCGGMIGECMHIAPFLQPNCKFKVFATPYTHRYRVSEKPCHLSPNVVPQRGQMARLPEYGVCVFGVVTCLCMDCRSPTNDRLSVCGLHFFSFKRSYVQPKTENP